MQHRELYRGIVPADAYIITYSDLQRVNTCASAARVAKEIYYKIPTNYSNDKQKDGTKSHLIKENETSPEWNNEVRLAYKMSDSYYVTGTIDRYHKSGIVEDFKTTTSPATTYLKTNQVDVYAFLAMNNDLVVTSGRYTTINKKGEPLDTVSVDISEATVVSCYASYILPRFNMIKKEIERLRTKYV